jgi:hypothetical protein
MRALQNNAKSRCLKIDRGGSGSASDRGEGFSWEFMRGRLVLCFLETKTEPILANDWWSVNMKTDQAETAFRI